MSHHMRALAVPLLAVALVAGLQSRSALAQETEPPPEGGSGNDNAVVAINTKDGFELFRVGFKITRATGEVVDAGNGAVAFSSCTECETIAAAYQVVLIFSVPQVVITENIAFAFNLECDTCVSVAYAYQGVFTTGGVVHFTPEGNRLLAELRRELHQLQHTDLTLEQLVAKLKELAQRLEHIVRNELVPAGPPSQAVSPQQPASDVGSEPTAEPAPEPTAEETTSPSPAPTSSPEPSASPSPTGG